MADVHDVILDQRNWLERILQRVPGFCGYYSRENRREADRVLRGYGVSRLDQLISELHEVIKRSPLEELQELRGVVTRVEKLRNELRFADQGYSGFFAELKWDSVETLDALYRIDEQIIESVTALAITVEAGEFEAIDLSRELRALERTLADRRGAILGLLPQSGGDGESGD